MKRLILAVLSSCTLAASGHAQTTQNPSPSGQGAAAPPPRAIATINLPAGPITAYAADRTFERVTIAPSAAFDVAMQMPREITTGSRVTVEPLDGGQIVGSSTLVVASDGTIGFRFSAPPDPGGCRISVHSGGRDVRLSFWVADAQHPENNPPTINSGGN